MTPIHDESSSKDKTKSVKFKLDSVDKKHPVDEPEEVASSESDTLHFEGAFHTDAIDDGIWMSEVNEEDSDCAASTHKPTLVPFVGSGDDWTVDDSNKGSGPFSFVQIPVIIGTSFCHVDTENDLCDLASPIILHGCMTLKEYLLRNKWTSDNNHTHLCTGCHNLGIYDDQCECGGTFTNERTNVIEEFDPHFICDELMKSVKEAEKEVVEEVNTKSSSTYYPHYFDAIDVISDNDTIVFHDPDEFEVNPSPFSGTPTYTPTDIPTSLTTEVDPSTAPMITTIPSNHDLTPILPSDTTCPTTPSSDNLLNEHAPSTLPTTVPTTTTLSYIAQMFTLLPNFILNMLLKQTFFINALAWDTIQVFYTPSKSSFSRKTNRRHLSKRNKISHKWAYPKHWMILSCLMIYPHFSAGSVHPISVIKQQLVESHSRIQRLHQLVDLSPHLFLNYNKWRYNDLFTSLVSTDSNDISHHLPTLKGESRAVINYFDTHSTQSSIDDLSLQTDFHDCLLPPSSHLPFFEFSSISAPHTHIHCSPSDDDDIMPPFPKAFNAELMGKVDLHPPTLPTGFPVIFDTGASLAISPSKSDFSGKIELFPYDRFLGGMAEGMKIEGIGNVKWSFRSKSGIITIHSSA